MADEPTSVTDISEKQAEPVPENAETEEQREVERQELTNFINELQAKITARTALRVENLNCVKPSESFFAKLDSSLKRNTAFVKKLKQFTAAQLEMLLKDMSGLNLTKYISEICAALSEAKLKMSDVPAVVTLCSKMHQTYTDFDTHFLEAWQKTLYVKPSEKISNPSKLRVDLRLFAELLSAGVIANKQGLSLLGSVLMNIISQDKDDHSNFPIILSFCRHCGEEYAGLVPKRMQNLVEKYGGVVIPKSGFLTPDKQQNLRNLLKDYFKNLCKHLVAEQTELLNMTKNIRRIVESRGEIPTDKKEKCELMQANFDKLLTSARTLSDLLDEPLPELAEETEICSPRTVMEHMIEDSSGAGELDPWGDDETKSFYTDLPDLRQFLPNFSSPRVDVEQIEDPVEINEEALDAADNDSEIELDDPPSTASDPATEKEAESSAELVNEEQPAYAVPSDKIGNALREAGRMSSGSAGNTKQQFDQFLNSLNNCVNRELTDSAAIDFLLNFNTKNNRKKLTKSIFSVQRTRLDLLPFLSRFVAIINLCNADVGVELSEMLRKEFKWHIRKKNQLNIESKIKIVRFIGELTKFGLCKKFDALGCLKTLLRDFQHHQIEMACAFLDVAGVYLYNSRDSRLMTNVFLDQMLRLKTATALDSRYASLVENVYYLVKPPLSEKRTIALRPPMQEYIRHLIFEELCKQNVDRCIKMMRRINWHDPEINDYAVRALSKAYLLRFPLIRCLADLVSGLSSYQERAVTQVIDNVFEDIRAGLEIHSPKLAQRRIAMAKYLGEMYNYKLVESNNIFNTLYSIIALGVTMSEGEESDIDPPGSLFRLKLAIVLLDTCGQYFSSTLSRKKLDYFLVFFQHYYWFKRSHPIFNKKEHNAPEIFPILVDHMYRDCLSTLRPKLKLYTSFEQAAEAVEKVRAELAQILGVEGVDSQAPTESASLVTIREDSEFDEAQGSDDSSSEVGGGLRRGVDVGDEDADDNIKHLMYRELGAEWADDINFNIEPPTPMKSKEDFEFEQMFEEMSAASHQERLRETKKTSTKDITVPMLARNPKKSYDQLAGASAGDSKANDKASDVPFVLMVRGGRSNKQQFKQFTAPSDSPLAVNLKLQEEKSRVENEKVKRLTLNITERIEEEDYQESLMQSPRNASQGHFPRANKPKFKHQKGAPDADLIFN